jgi:hypothetical protein
MSGHWPQKLRMVTFFAVQWLVLMVAFVAWFELGWGSGPVGGSVLYVFDAFGFWIFMMI